MALLELHSPLKFQMNLSFKLEDLPNPRYVPRIEPGLRNGPTLGVARKPHTAEKAILQSITPSVRRTGVRKRNSAAAVSRDRSQ